LDTLHGIADTASAMSFDHHQRLFFIARSTSFFSRSALADFAEKTTVPDFPMITTRGSFVSL